MSSQILNLRRGKEAKKGSSGSACRVMISLSSSIENESSTHTGSTSSHEDAARGYTILFYFCIVRFVFFFSPSANDRISISYRQMQWRKEIGMSRCGRHRLECSRTCPRSGNWSSTSHKVISSRLSRMSVGIVRRRCQSTTCLPRSCAESSMYN